ncbi:unnamed protein product [Mytilus edulis]|uniref:Ig-like domain-containing protein n=1 Tax=Mytilus edulis TaxID=6550 RepID=A0A8S3R2K2_MYTED|nr:unnamed protein product [Mytilus edulis]
MDNSTKRTERIIKQTTQSERNRVLLDILTDRPYNTFDMFIEVLHESDQINDDVQEIVSKIKCTKNNDETYSCHDITFHEHIVQLQKNYKMFVDDGDCRTDIADYLYQKDVLNTEEKKITKFSLTRQESNRILCDKFFRKGMKKLRERQRKKDCFPEDPFNVECIKGEDAIMTCKIRPGSQPVKWMKDCNAIRQNETCQMYNEDTQYSLKLKNTTTSDSGEYLVQVGQFSKTLNLTIRDCFPEDPPNDGNVDCFEGEDAIMTCKVCPGSQSVKWIKDGNEIRQSENCQMYNEDAHYKLKLRNTITSDNGQYVVQTKTIPGGHTDDIDILRENAIRNFEVEIKLLKNKANRYEHNYKIIDEEMFETFVAKFNAEITESINNLWRSDCEKEEIKSVQIWERKQLWLEEYEDHFGDLFVTEENTQVDNAYKKKTFPRKERKVQRNYPGTSHNTDDNLTNQAVVHVSHTPHTNIQPRNKPKTKRTEPFFRTTQDERQRGRDNRPQYTEPNSIISQHELRLRLRGDIPEGNSLTNTEKIHPRIINLSHRKLQLREINLLKRGLKFTPTPNEDKTQLGADIDEFGRRLRINYIFCKDNEENEEEENKPLVRNKSDWIPRPTKDKDLEETIKTLKTNSLTSNKNVKDNLTREEKTALQNLKSDKSIIIKEADKGNAVVIMDREYYRDSILNMLQDEMSYEVTDKKLDRQTSTMIKKLLKKHETELFKEEIDYISNSKFSESYFYGLPKIHKSEEISNAISEQNSEYIELLRPNDFKFRPIVGGPNSVTHNLSHFIEIF